MKGEGPILVMIFIMSALSLLMISAMWYCILVEPVEESVDVVIIDKSNFSSYDVNVSGDIIVGADKEPVRVVNNPNAKVVSYENVMEFLEQDDTNEIEYETGVFVCTEFSELTHNNAEERGIIAGLLVVTFNEGKTGHMFNAFPTTDKGIIYVDTQSDAVIQSFCIGQEIEYFNENKRLNGTIRDIYQFW